MLKRGAATWRSRGCEPEMPARRDDWLSRADRWSRTNGKTASRPLIPMVNFSIQRGELSFVGSTVDCSTGTVVSRSTVGNKDLALLPGQYPKVRLRIKRQPDGQMVPRAKGDSGQQGKFVYMFGQDGKAGRHLVTLSATQISMVAVVKLRSNSHGPGTA
jgi:membrane fusion protein, multidrug efflux system